MQDPLHNAITTLIQSAAEAGYLVESVAFTRPDRPSQPVWPVVSVNGQVLRFQSYYVQPYYPQYQQHPFWNTVMSQPPPPKPPAKEFICPRCSASFKTNSNMQKHIRTVHDNARPFKCDQCDAAYGHKNLLVEHVRTRHNGERPFVCDICGARFGRSSNLYSHMKSHDGKREHVCETCHVSFSLHGNMVKHIKTVHLKQRPFECTTCGSRFGLRSDLTRHSRNVHGIMDKRPLDTGGPSSAREHRDAGIATGAASSAGVNANADTHANATTATTTTTTRLPDSSRGEPHNSLSHQHTSDDAARGSGS